jgi:hypothetical protein
VLLSVAASSALPSDAPPRRPSSSLGEPFLWRVERGRATSHLFGTCHLPIDLEKALRRVGLEALDRSRRVFVELDISSQATIVDVVRIVRSRAQMPDRSLKALLPPPLWSRLVNIHEGHLDAATLDHLRPWAAGFMTYSRLAEKARSQPRPRDAMDPGRPILDAAVAARAKDRNIHVEPLETPLQQVQIFNAQRFEDELRMLTDVLEHPEASDESPRMLDGCIAFDERVIREETARLMQRLPEFADRLLGQRNRAWVDRLDRWLSDGDMFVAVGAAHMSGNAGLVTLLRKRGYRVSRERAIPGPCPP